MAIEDRIKAGTSLVGNIFGGTPAKNVYDELSYLARQQYGVDADELNRQKEMAETKATQQFARKRTHGGAGHAQALRDIATADIGAREDAANKAIANMRASRTDFESLAPELYKLAAAGKISTPGSSGLRSGGVTGRPGSSTFAGGYTPGASSLASRALYTGSPVAPGASYIAGTRKMII